MNLSNKLETQINRTLWTAFAVVALCFCALAVFVESSGIVFWTFLAVLSASFFFLRRRLRELAVEPLQRLANAMGDFCDETAQRPARRFENGLGEAALLFKSMAEQNANMRRELSQLNQALEEKVRERTRRSDEANRAKSAFLANMSHELRTPLNAILGFTGIISKKKGLPEEIAEQLAIVRKSGEYLLLLINDVLDLSKIEAGQMELNEAPMDLYRLNRELFNMFCIKASNKDLELHFEPATDLPRYIVADELKLKQILINFIDNAVKFTSEGAIRVRAKVSRIEEEVTATASGELRFEVEDTGAGISAEEKQHLFKAFVQTSAGQKSKQGTGLGLAISYQYIKMMGGEIDVQSAPDKGSLFSFSIPLTIASVENGDLDQQMDPHREMDAFRSRGKPFGEQDGSCLRQDAGPEIEVPADLLRQLEEASRTCDLGEVEECIERIRKISSRLASEFSRLAGEFNFDIIIERIRDMEHKA